jgi:sugar/nucleoside kinase (ribokinase family)
MKDYVVFMGDVALDEYYTAPRWPAIKEKIAVEALPAQCGGMIANAACVYASMGQPTRFMTILNSGPVTRVLLDDLANSGVDTDGLIIYDESLPDSKTIIILAEGEHTVFIPDLHVELTEISPRQLDILRGASHIYSTPTRTKTLRCGNMRSEEILSVIRAAGVKIVYDLDVGYLKEEEERFYQGIDIAFFNEAGFASYQGPRSEEQAVADLLSYGLEVVVVTRAEKGCSVYSPKYSFAAPALKVDPVDVTGAGDTFCATFLFTYKKTADLAYAARFANTAAGICVETVGPRAGAVGEAAVLARMDELGSK